MARVTIAQALAQAVDARARCIKANNLDWKSRHESTIAQLVANLPSGSGWDNGTKIDLDRSTGEKLVFFGSFHHMNENGYYDGWTDHTITVRPGFNGLNVTISGRDRNEIKDHLAEIFDSALSEEYRPVQAVQGGA